MAEIDHLLTLDKDDEYFGGTTRRELEQKKIDLEQKVQVECQMHGIPCADIAWEEVEDGVPEV